MNHELSSQLESLAPLSPANRESAPCKVCGHAAYLFDVVDFNKCCSDSDCYPFGVAGVSVTYLRCSVCDFMFTSLFDDWTIQDFARFVYNDEYIKVDAEYAGIRPEREAVALAQRLSGNTHLEILDYGSGSGLFAEEMKARGFARVRSYDPFSSPVRPEGRFDLITCFEVLEHSPAPKACLADIADFLKPGGCILFSTGIQPPDIAHLRANWWYVAPRNGHVSIYSINSLMHLGRSVGLTLYASPGATAFAGSNPTADSSVILSTVGSPVRFLHLTAPAADRPLIPDQRRLWHGPEGGNEREPAYRWTAQPEIVWAIQNEQLAAGHWILTIPLVNEIQPGFADDCRLAVGASTATLVRRGNLLTAALTLDRPADPIVRLITPGTLRPCDIRPVFDARSLGIAIATESNAP